jgi:hypothetical protein
LIGRYLPGIGSGSLKYAVDFPVLSIRIGPFAITVRRTDPLPDCWDDSCFERFGTVETGKARMLPARLGREYPRSEEPFESFVDMKHGRLLKKGRRKKKTYLLRC